VNCEGTDDHPSAAKWSRRFYVHWHNVKHSDDEYAECLDAEGKPALEPYLQCPLRASAPAGASCQDKEVLDEPHDALEARLSVRFCEPGGKLVGRAFLDQMLATLDANNDGSVSCAEWGMAKMTSTLEELGGAYRGPPSIAPPECPMTAQGAETVAQYNAYLAGLSSSASAAAAAQGR
jgi:hypothetical protein